MARSERIVMVGAGYWSQFQVEGWRDAGVPLAAIANRHLGPAQALAARYGVPRSYDDIARMLDAERPTLVDVCLPPVAQEPVVRAAVERGIPTICQKPFGIDLQQAEAMTALAEAAGVPLVVHENFRFAPWFRELRRCIDAGLLGRVHGIAFRLRPGDDVLPPITPYFVMKVGHVPLVPYRAPGDAEVADLVAARIAAMAARGTPIRAVLLDRLGPNVWHRSPTEASAVLEELEETARLWLSCQPRPAPLNAEQIETLRQRFGAAW